MGGDKREKEWMVDAMVQCVLACLSVWWALLAFLVCLYDCVDQDPTATPLRLLGHRGQTHYFCTVLYTALLFSLLSLFLYISFCLSAILSQISTPCLRLKLFVFFQ